MTWKYWDSWFESPPCFWLELEEKHLFYSDFIAGENHSGNIQVHSLSFFFLLSCKITRQSKPFLRVLFPLSFSCSYPPVHSGEEQRYPYVLGWYLCIWKDNCCTCGMNVLPKEMNKNTVTSFQVCCWMLVVVFLKRTTSLKWTNLWSLACL